ncbi:Variant-specific surface protein, partial [Giardia duodenalis]
VKTAGRTNVCTAASGKCTACTGAYALISGGCYGAAKLPGKVVCTAANNGECTTCANGQQPSGKVCPACPAGCSKCTGSAPSQQCSGCFPGYYKSGDKCVKCDASANGIVGVPNCVSCAPPTGNSGSVICYVKTDGTDNGGSTNKSGLSTGAIAGIAVVAVIVVGGLVGFLCWWFICRGKA